MTHDPKEEEQPTVEQTTEQVIELYEKVFKPENVVIGATWAADNGGAW